MITVEIDKVIDAGKSEKVTVSGNSMKNWEIMTNLPKDAAFRSREIAVGLKISGYIIPGYKDQFAEKSDAVTAAKNGTLGLADWARAASADLEAYRKLTLKQITAGVTERIITLNDCYIANYKEHWEASKADGKFEAEIRVRRINEQGTLFGFAFELPQS